MTEIRCPNRQVIERFGGASRDRTDDLIVANDGVRHKLDLISITSSHHLFHSVPTTRSLPRSLPQQPPARVENYANSSISSQIRAQESDLILRHGCQALKYKQHPAVALSNSAWRQVPAFCLKLGFSPLSRKRLSLEKQHSGEPDLLAILCRPESREPAGDPADGTWSEQTEIVACAKNETKQDPSNHARTKRRSDGLDRPKRASGRR